MRKLNRTSSALILITYELKIKPKRRTIFFVNFLRKRWQNSENKFYLDLPNCSIKRQHTRWDPYCDTAHSQRKTEGSREKSSVLHCFWNEVWFTRLFVCPSKLSRLPVRPKVKGDTDSFLGARRRELQNQCNLTNCSYEENERIWAKTTDN